MTTSIAPSWRARLAGTVGLPSGPRSLSKADQEVLRRLNTIPGWYRPSDIQKGTGTQIHGILRKLRFRGLIERRKYEGDHWSDRAPVKMQGQRWEYRIR